MEDWTIHVEDQALPDDMRYVVRRLQEYNTENSPVPFERRDIRLFARNAAGEIVAGLLGSVHMHCLVIQIMWVSDEIRRHGLGRQLVEQAEQMAVESGARQSLVETTTFQAPGFYQRLGYQVICEIADCPVGSSSLLMRKPL